MDWKGLFLGLLTLAVVVGVVLLVLYIWIEMNAPEEPTHHLGTIDWDDVESFILSYK